MVLTPEINVKTWRLQAQLHCARSSKNVELVLKSRCHKEREHKFRLTFVCRRRRLTMARCAHDRGSRWQLINMFQTNATGCATAWWSGDSIYSENLFSLVNCDTVDSKRYFSWIEHQDVFYLNLQKNPLYSQCIWIRRNPFVINTFLLY